MSTTDRDGSRYAQASKQMLETGNYFQINFQNAARHLKPPGIYWLQALSVNILNNGNPKATWPYRIPSLLGALLSALFTFEIGRRLFSRKVGLIAASFLATSLFVILEAHIISTDAMFMATTCLMQGALMLIYCSIRKNAEKPNLFPIIFIFWLAMAMGILVKGLAPIFSILTIIGLCIADRNITWLKSLKIHWGLPLVILLSLGWLIPLSYGSHSNFLMDMLRKDVLPKLIAGHQGHGLPPGFYLLTLPVLLWPGSLFLVRGMHFGWQFRVESAHRFLLAWIIPSWLLFAIIPTKLPEYLMPLYPAICLLMANAIIAYKQMQVSKRMRFIYHLCQGIWLILGVGIAAFILYITVSLTHHWLYASIWSSVVIICMSVMSLIAYNRHKMRMLLSTLVIGSIFAFAPFYQFTLPNLSALWMSRNVSQIIERLAPQSINDSKPLLSIGYVEPSLVFYVGTHRVLFTNLLQAIRSLEQNKSALVLMNSKQLSEFNKKIKQKKIVLQKLATLRGFNINTGSKWETLILFQKIS